MSEEMSTSWRYLSSAGSKLSSLKGYLSARDPLASAALLSRSATPPNTERQSWRQWAGQKIRVRRRRGLDPSNSEVINIFPGWAARRYAADSHSDNPQPFEVEVFVSGFAISHRSPENATRSQRAFIRLAKGFAALPKLVEDALEVPQNASTLAKLTPSTEELLSHVELPPRPTDIADGFNIDELDRELHQAQKADNDEDYETRSDTSSVSSRRSSLSDLRPVTPPPGIPDAMPNELLKRLHANLEQRLQPFWSSVLPNRIIRLHLFVSSGHNRDSTIMPSEELAFDSEHGPLASQEVTTGPDGSFQAKFRVKWEDLCQHPKALHIAFGEVEEHELLLVAQLLPPLGHPGVANMSSETLPPPFTPTAYVPRQSHRPSQSHDARGPASPSPPAPLASIIRIPITHSPIRVISDIDDTVKFSGVLSGARAVFHNVFVKDLSDNVIAGMGEWYTSMFSRGVRFHYVSNGPFAILPVVNDFFQVSQLPPGSIKLKSYAGRSLFDGFLSAPASRKRAGVVDVLDSFPGSRFILIGDTGEQDLELYADLARERPQQILGAFLRDADAFEESIPPLDDPTGWKAMGAAGTRPDGRPLVPRTDSSASGISPGSGSSAASGPSFLSKYMRYGSTDSKAPPRADSLAGSVYNVQAPTPDTNLDRTPRPVQSGVATDVTPVFSDAKAESAQRRPGSAQTGQDTYFNTGHVYAEPESTPDAQTTVNVATPTMRSNQQMEPSATITSGMNRTRTASLRSGIPSRSQVASDYIVNQAPKATPPPSIHNPSTHPHSLDPSSASFKSQRTGASEASSTSSTHGGRKGTISEIERKRNELQQRVYRARTQMPSHVPLRVFREPAECVEVQEILDREEES